MSNVFSKISRGINKRIVSVGTNSKAMMEKAKINTVIKNLEDQYDQLAALLGKKVYTQYKSGGEITVDENMVGFFTEIDKRLELITKQQEQLKRIEEEVNLVTGSINPVLEKGAVCKCGHTNHESSKFCAKCGSQL